MLTSHPKTWEIVNFGLRIGSSEKIRHSQFEIRNAEVVGRILGFQVRFGLVCVDIPDVTFIGPKKIPRGIHSAQERVI